MEADVIPAYMDLDRSIVSHLKNARHVVQLSLEGILPPDIAFMSALVLFDTRTVLVTEQAPIVIADHHKELADAINAEGGHAILHSDARNPSNMVVGGEQFRLISGDTIPLVTINNDLERPVVPMLKRDRTNKPLCVPGGRASSPDVAAEELSQELGLVIFHPQFGSATVIKPVVKLFSDPSRTIEGFCTDEQQSTISENIARVWDRAHSGRFLDDIYYQPTPMEIFSLTDEPVSFVFNDRSQPIKVAAELVEHWELMPGKDNEQNIVGIHGYTHINVNLNRELDEQLYVVDPEPFGELDPATGAPMGRNGVSLNLHYDTDWRIGRQLVGGLGPFENTGFLSWANTLTDASVRSRLAKHVLAI